MKELRLLPEVLEDATQAAQWYDEHGYIGLGERFLAVFYSILPQIQQQGEVYRPVYLDFRRLLLHPFPYFIYYRLHHDWVVISLVVHAARDPQRIRQILRQRKSNP